MIAKQMQRFAPLARWLALGLLMTPSSASPAAEHNPRPTEERRQQCLAKLRQALGEEQRWIKVHAAEYLLWLDYPQGVSETFQEELALHGREPEYRIGIWRVLAQAERDPRRAAPWVARVREAFLDPSAPDRLHAVETLAKLNAKATEEVLGPLEEAARQATGAMAVFSRWVLLNSGLPGAEDRLAELLDSPDETTRRLAGYCFGRIPSVSPGVSERLASAASREAPASPAHAALAAAAAIHGPRDSRGRFKQLVLSYARTGTVEQRLRALEALGRVADEGDLGLLEELLSDPDADVRAAAAWAALRVERRASRGLGAVDWAVIVLYALGMLAIGWHYWRQSRTSEDYLLGGRKMKSLPVGLSLFATLFSTISYLAWPGEIIKYGPMLLSICVAYPLVAIVAGRYLIPHIMSLKITSAYELLEVRLGLAVRLLGSTLFLLLRVLWMSVIVYATVGTVLMPLLGLDPSLTPWVCAILGSVTLVYTAMGGLRAVVWTDVLQALILFAGALAAIVAVTVYLGGVWAWWPKRWEPHWTEPVFYDPNVRVTFLGAVLATFTWYVATAGSDQMAVQRYLATRDAPAARKVLNTSLAANALVFLLLASLGLALLAYFQANPHHLPDGRTLYDGADLLFTRFVAVGLPPGFSGLVIAGLLAAAMSSLSAGINASCSVVIADFVDRFGLRRGRANGPSQGTPPPSSNGHAIPAGQERNSPEGSIVPPRGGAWLERCISVAIGILMVVLSSFVGAVHGNLLEIAYKVVNLLSAPIFGLFCMAMFVSWATGFGALVGAAAGLAVVVAINFWEELTGAKGISFLWAMPLSFVTQMAVGMACSLLPLGRSRRRLEDA